MESTPDPTSRDAEPARPLTLEAILEEKIFEANGLREPHWLRDGRRFSYLGAAPNESVTTVWTYDLRSGDRRAVIEVGDLKLPRAVKAPASTNDDDDDDARHLRITGYQWSPDEKNILFARIAHWRSAAGDNAIYVYNLATRKLTNIGPAGEPKRNAKWRPDSRHVGYVRGDNLHVVNVVTGRETRLTDSAQPEVYNGRFGWVYEEELELTDGWSWSPDGKRIAYYQIDERPVPIAYLPNIDDPHQATTTMRYPNAGDPNPIVRIGLMDVPATLDAGVPVPETRWADLGPDRDIYIARMQWTPKGDLLLQRLPRLQNRIDLLRVDPETARSNVALTEEDAAWLDISANVTFVGHADEFLWLSERSGFRHVYRCDLNGGDPKQITSGQWEVDKISGVDFEHREVFFTAARPDPTQRRLFSTLIDGGADVVELTTEPGAHSPLFSPDCRHYLDTHSSRSAPPKVNLHQSSGARVAVVHDNPMPKLEGRKPGEWEFETFKASDGATLHAAILKPHGFDPKKSYPVLIYVYGGPGFQSVLDQYGGGSGFEQLIAQKGYVVAMIDGRGSSGQGREFEKIVYKRLGYWESRDQIDGAKWLGTLPYVDAKRIGIWGWSYGGYVSTLCILRGADVFKAAAAVAPVTDWRLYDSIYTERYMRLPIDNSAGFDAASAIGEVNSLKGKYLLMHGTADDNVHFLNSARLAAALQKAGKQFRFMVYPGKRHDLEGVSLHVFSTLTDFIVENV